MKWSNVSIINSITASTKLTAFTLLIMNLESLEVALDKEELVTSTKLRAYKGISTETRKL